MKLSIIKHRLYIFIIVSAFCLNAALYLSERALAFNTESYSMPEQVAFAYFKLSGYKNPNFDKLVKTSEQYQKTPQAYKQTKLIEEKNRLYQGFTNYYPEFGRIELQTEVIIRGLTTLELQDAHDEGKYYIKLTPKTGNTLLFPVFIGDRWVAVIPSGFDAFGKLELSKSQYMEIEKKVNFTKRQSKPVNLKIVVQPSAVDNKAPILFGDTEMWLMLAEIGNLTIWRQGMTKKNDFIYNYTAPWYVSDGSRDLLNLYKQ